MKKILIINNNMDPPFSGCTDIVRYLSEHLPQFGATEIFTCHGPSGELPENTDGIDAVCMSGSKTRIDESAPWIEHQLDFIRELYKKKKPTLGICYGEQMIAKALGGEKTTGVSNNYEYGWGKIELLPEAKDSAIFYNLPQTFYSYESHSDEVKWLPPNFRLVAKSEDCPVQAYDVLDAPMWGVQFHPERLLADGMEGLENLSKKDPARKLLNRDLGPKVFDKKIANIIFHNFLQVLWHGKAKK